VIKHFLVLQEKFIGITVRKTSIYDKTAFYIGGLWMATFRTVVSNYSVLTSNNPNIPLYGVGVIFFMFINIQPYFILSRLL